LPDAHGDDTHLLTVHELAIAEGVVEAVGERFGGARVLRVVLRVGRLACIEPDAIRFCFDACARGTAVEGAALEIVDVPARARCRECGAADVEVDARIPLCPCGSAELEVLSGQELTLAAVEVA
jgi:hydrogenase nickel incorporation protein HypA/HybF